MTPPPLQPPEGDDGDPPFRGWIDPDDRLWRHPSEVAAAHAVVATAASDRSRLHRYRDSLMVAVGVSAAMAAVAGLVVLLSPASDKPQPMSSSDAVADAPLTTLAANQQGVPAVAAEAGHAMVRLQADTSRGVVFLTAVAVAEGGLVATTADTLSATTTISMIGTDGRLWRAKLVGIDRASDLALITVPDDVPVAPFADDTTLTGGAPDLLLTLAGSGTGVPSLRCEPGAIGAVATSVDDGPASGMPAIVSTTSAALAESGDPLLSTNGAVLGLLYNDDHVGTGPSAMTFLPSQLILGVADDLRSDGKVAPGWLGVVGTNTATTGATVMAVKPGSPAAGQLVPGEVIVGVNEAPVRSMAELVARLYVLAPNTPVALSVVDGSARRVVDVTLGTSP